LGPGRDQEGSWECQLRPPSTERHTVLSLVSQPSPEPTRNGLEQFAIVSAGG
jgi:hypothetical protein